MAFIEPAPSGGAVPFARVSEQADSWLIRADDIDSLTAQCFLASARCGCFMQAARSLNIKSTQLRKQLALLEEQVNRTLFVYQGNALMLSREGQQLQARLLTLAHERKLPIQEQPVVRLAVAEAILHDILGRDLIALLRRNASVRLDIVPVDSLLALQALSADVVVWLADSAAGDDAPDSVIGEVRWLAQIDYVPHIAKRYSRIAARPAALGDLEDFMLVRWQPDSQVEALAPWNALVEQRLAGVVQVHAYDLMLEMIRCSACVGLLPRYITRFDRAMASLPGLFAEPMQRQAWMVVERSAQARVEVQQVVEMILNSFQERRDWFE